MTTTLRERKKLRTRQAIADAGLALFARDGYAATSIADIAEAADVSPRTVFRYFADKEELVFVDDPEHLAAIMDAIESADDRSSPLDVMRRAGHAFAAALETRREQLLTWLQLVAEEPALQARSLAKQRRWEELIAERLAARPSVTAADARLAAKVGVACTQTAIEAWAAEPSGPLARHVDRAFRRLAHLASA